MTQIIGYAVHQTHPVFESRLHPHVYPTADAAREDIRLVGRPNLKSISTVVALVEVPHA